MALMGHDRIQEFIINHILPGEGSEKAWKLYLTRQGVHAGARVLSIHQRLLGKRKDAAAFLKRAWHHQALLQIHEDLCFRHSWLHMLPAGAYEECLNGPRPFPSALCPVSVKSGTGEKRSGQPVRNRPDSEDSSAAHKRNGM